NPIRTTGDGYLLAWQAGAQLQDMEFVQFYPLGFAEPGFPIWFISLRSIDVAPLTNAAGERFLEPLLVQWGIKNGREANLFARDRAAVAIARERRQGDVYLHLEKVPPENWQDQDLKGLLPLFPAWFPRREKPVRVAPVQHYFAGGVTIDTDGWTGVPGLFACGEVTGGVDGANRVGGNALSNLTVFGLRAGRAAAECAQGAARGWPRSHLAAGETYPPKDGGSRAERASKPAGTPVREAGPFDSGGVFAGAALPELDPTSLVKRWLSRRDGTSPQELRDKINDLAERCLGPLRDEAGLREAQRELSELWRLLGEISLHGSEDLLLALENRSLLFTAQLVAEAAWQREESRGVHYREDFPAERTQWQRHITLRGNRGRLQWGRKPV
ncbi:MAG: FAD-binding protein, partial [Firmicutes bacterium]|nr:FAD-binding protein [Bacillota bacterium]